MPARKVDHSSGRALEILGHAIGILIDDYEHHGIYDGSTREAVGLLNRARRDILLACPLELSIAQRLLRFVGRRTRRNATAANRG